MYSSKTKQVYIRKIFPHDLTHEVSITTEIVNEFFEGKTSMTFYKGSDRTPRVVTINSVTDPRFGGAFASLWTSDNLELDDLIIIKKLSASEYELTTAKRGSALFDYMSGVMTGNKRHSVVVTEDVESRSPCIVPSVSSCDLSSTDFDYIAAIKAKPFLILGGFSGTGKSQKVKELAFATCPCDSTLNLSETSPGNYLLVSVKPNWHDSTDLFGFESSVNGNYFVTDFMRFLVKAKMYEAEKVPFFVCIDEMNLAPVEEYFAEFLSVIESRKLTSNGRIVTAPLVSNEVFSKKYENAEFNIFMSLGLQTTNEEWDAADINELGKDEQDAVFERQDIVYWLKTEGLTIPQNVVIVGTVNMDDTTNSFSRKVIDRAMTFEMLVEEITDEFFDAPKQLGYVKEPLDGEMFISDIVRADEVGSLESGEPWITPDDRSQLKDFINGINEDMEGSPFKVSYRVLNETILLYFAKWHLHDNYEEYEELAADDFVELSNVFDAILMQKVLPRIEGDYDKCNTLLENLKERAEQNGWEHSVAKIEEMIDRFGNDKSGFTTFWN